MDIAGFESTSKQPSIADMKSVPDKNYLLLPRERPGSDLSKRASSGYQTSHEHSSRSRSLLCMDIEHGKSQLIDKQFDNNLLVLQLSAYNCGSRWSQLLIHKPYQRRLHQNTLLYPRLSQCHGIRRSYH